MNEEPRVGLQVLLDRALNKGTGFSADERSDLHLEGLLPAAVDTLDLQVQRALDHLAAKPNDLEQYIYLQELCDRNSTLFYALLMSDPARFIPIVYDPTIADACLTYGHIYRRPQGMYLTKKMQGRFAQVLANWPNPSPPAAPSIAPGHSYAPPPRCSHLASAHPAPPNPQHPTPPLPALTPNIEITTATRIAEHIFDRGLATVDRPDDIRAWIKGLTYTPTY